ncbi:hypothetical protein MtrunA17_Chr1g0172791 [Medicago truncatula]|uniref:Transmembrane protein n=1 Tax=Medicago truncatula TaxID=3880 RepID=A0A396JLC5_MEDTR|nr:hypothetical protein MtrunA17_Chr1g0172791 [Medicago truncatula]
MIPFAIDKIFVFHLFHPTSKTYGLHIQYIFTKLILYILSYLYSSSFLENSIIVYIDYFSMRF